jgi:TPR repeat protein
MKRAVNYAIATIFLLLSFVAPVIARPLEDGATALGRGDYATAETIFRPLAEHGDAQAQYFLGTMYLEGHEVPRRRVVAAQWYRKAADQGYRDAQAALGEMYFGGYGDPHNDARAFSWWRKAAHQRDSGAQNSLGIMYENGIDVPKNLVLAYKWYSLAVTGDPNYKLATKGELDGISLLMTPAQIAKAQNLAREWKPTTVRAVHLVISAVTDRFALNLHMGGQVSWLFT